MTRIRLATVEPDVEEQIAALAAAHQYDPAAWARIAWDWGRGDLAGFIGPRPWQREILEVIRDHLANPATRHSVLQIAVSSGHGVGKSASMGMIANWAMSCWVDARVLVTANTETQLRTKTSPELLKWAKLSITAHWFDLQTMSIKSLDDRHSESWRLDCIPWSATNTEAFQGLHNLKRIILLLFDESSKIADKVWEVAENALTDEDTVLIWLAYGNPTQNSGRFRECFRRFRHRWVTRQIDARDVDGTNKERIRQQIEDHGIDSDYVKIRIRGEFPAQSARQFISGEDVDEARTRFLRPEQYDFAPKILSLEPAWTGDDELVWGLRQGLRFEILRTMQRNDNDVLVANITAQLEDEHRADGVVIDAGYGTGIYSVGQTIGRQWHLVWYGSASPDPGCLNMRAYMWRQMRDWLKAGGTIDAADKVLADDLVGPETLPRLDGKVALEAKEDMKGRGIPSPNRGDCLAQTFAVAIAKKDRNPSGQQVESDYDPYA